RALPSKDSRKMFHDLFTSRLRRTRRRHEKRARGFRPGLEALEDRLTPSASKVFAGLEFMTSGTFTTNNHLVTATGAVQVGVAPPSGGTFTPVLSLDGGVKFTDNDPAGMFTTTGTVSGVSGGKTTLADGRSLLLLDAHQHTFTAPGLLGANNYYALGAG